MRQSSVKWAAGSGAKHVSARRGKLRAEVKVRGEECLECEDGARGLC